MRKLRYALVAVLVLFVITPPTASASCIGVLCGAYCGVEEVDYCVVVWGGNETNACRNIGNDGCMSMASLICCPRDPRE